MLDFGREICGHLDHHGNTHAGNWHMRVNPVPHGLQVMAFEGATPRRLPRIPAFSDDHSSPFTFPKNVL
jgi:hypothetical protein